MGLAWSRWSAAGSLALVVTTMVAGCGGQAGERSTTSQPANSAPSTPQFGPTLATCASGFHRYIETSLQDARNNEEGNPYIVPWFATAQEVDPGSSGSMASTAIGTEGYLEGESSPPSGTTCSLTFAPTGEGPEQFSFGVGSVSGYDPPQSISGYFGPQLSVAAQSEPANVAIADDGILTPLR
jgi:hypothetical protein